MSDAIDAQSLAAAQRSVPVRALNPEPPSPTTAASFGAIPTTFVSLEEWAFDVSGRFNDRAQEILKFLRSEEIDVRVRSDLASVTDALVDKSTLSAALKERVKFAINYLDKSQL